MDKHYEIEPRDIDCNTLQLIQVPELQGEALQIAKDKALVAYKEV